MVFDYMDHDLTGLMQRRGNKFEVKHVRTLPTPSPLVPVVSNMSSACAAAALLFRRCAEDEPKSRRLQRSAVLLTRNVPRACCWTACSSHHLRFSI